MSLFCLWKYVAEHETFVVPIPVNVPRFVGGEPSQALPMSEVTTFEAFTLLGMRVKTEVAGLDCQVMLSPASVDSASPVTRSQPVAGSPVEVRTSMFVSVMTAVDPWTTV